MTDEELIGSARALLERVPGTRSPAINRVLDVILLVLLHVVRRQLALEGRLRSAEPVAAPQIASEGVRRSAVDSRRTKVNGRSGRGDEDLGDTVSAVERPHNIP